MPTVTFSYTITASLAAPVSHFGYAVRVPSDTGRQLLRRQHLAFPEGGPKLEKLDPLGNRILTGIHRGTSARLAFTVSGKARIEPDQAEEGSMELYNGQTFRTGAGGLLRSCYLHHSAVGDAPDRTRHFCLMLRDEFSCRRGLPSHRTAEEAMEDTLARPRIWRTLSFRCAGWITSWRAMSRASAGRALRSGSRSGTGATGYRSTRQRHKSATIAI